MGMNVRIISAASLPISSSSTHSTRSFANAAAKTSTTSKDTRLAGRPRFYKKVDIKALDAAPWETFDSVLSSKLASNDDKSIESPISAGVDGTQSATGVHHMDINGSDSNALNNFEIMLTPRIPGEAAAAAATTTTEQSPRKWYGVTLDGRTLSTPMGQTLALPSQSLAYMVAAEWDAQTTQLQPTNMPLMTLACTVLDQAALHPKHYQDEALKYLPTDTTCFWADPLEDRVLYRRQEQAWSSLHQYIEQNLGEKPTTALGMEGILMSRRRKGKGAGLPHPSPLMDAAKEWTHSLDAWQLIALNSINAQSKSWMVGYAMLMHGGPFDDLADAIEASRVEEEFQISNWGLVEGGHDYDRVNCSIQLHAASLFNKAVAESAK